MRTARHVVGAISLLAALWLPGSAPAQTDDPDRGSPSGVIYEIPLDNARQDAAPAGVRRRGGANGRAPAGSGTDGGTVSQIRSENGFGSSSTVPGAAAASATRDRSRASKSRGKGTGGQGSDSAAGSVPTASAESIRGTGSASITPSKSRAYLLLLLALVVAAGLGTAGRYIARRR